MDKVQEEGKMTEENRIVKCRGCGGSGDCKRCEGKGVTTCNCPRCKGTGICLGCEGSGWYGARVFELR